jgi:hypothetical protein
VLVAARLLLLEMAGCIATRTTAAADPLWIDFSKSKPELPYSRWSVGQSVLVSVHHLRLENNFSFTSTENIFRHLQFSSCWAPSPTSGRVCNLSVEFLLGPASTTTLRSKSKRSHDYILLPHLRQCPLFLASYDS